MKTRRDGPLVEALGALCYREITMRAVAFAFGWALLAVHLTAEGGERLIPATGTSRTLQMVADSPTSGIEGRVTIRPVRPVERRGVANQRPYRARITVLDATGREVATVESDEDGRFRLPLSPGSYVLRPESPGLYPRASEQHVLVRHNDVTHIEIVYDSGMR